GSGGFLAGRGHRAGDRPAPRPAVRGARGAVHLPADGAPGGRPPGAPGTAAAGVHGSRQPGSGGAARRRRAHAHGARRSRVPARLASVPDGPRGLRRGDPRPRRLAAGPVRRRLTMDGAMRDGEPWLPDLCRLPRLATLFGVAELVVLVLLLAPRAGAGWNLERFASASGFALWLSLTIAVLLCSLRGVLSRLPVALGALGTVASAFAVALLGAAMVFHLDRNLGTGLVPAGMQAAPFALGSAAIAALITAVAVRYFYVLDGWKAQVRASALAQADALQARIRPHFLFNSLNAIVGLVRRDPVVAEQALLDLSDLFRAALGAGESGS